MYTKIVALTLIAFCSLSFTGSFNQTKDQTAVGQAVEQLRLLMISPDKAKLEALAADELSYGHSSGKIEDKAAFVEALTSGTSDFVSIELVDQTISVTDNTALVRHKLMGETLDNGKPGQVKLSVLQVWIKQKGNWKLLARQAVKI
ncbi:nuclear transport factor 2 family protein [Spirosoma sp. KCTC 42546]|uniref:nuclear transport factor 2 family protein n=1 Tax=Spirosoma sp. KCTC 42546 TaxID=2520506 RepID=UPI00115A1604|nr:nuclear transport factor 2 family protein [Spirosoma sp. KCTC 42546]QDK81490.1 nuclear transport factor 2 family protein [Spirosoma sp. KCTC 42546]